MSLSTIDFGRTMSRSYSLSWVGAMSVLVALLVLAGGLAALMNLRLEQQGLLQEIERTDQDLEAIRRAASATVRPVPEATVLTAPQATAVSTAVHGLNVPWRDLLDAVEAATPDSVAVLALEPEPQRRQLLVVAEALSVDEMLGYVDRLKRGKRFASVVLSKHETMQQEPQTPIRFHVVARWQDDSKVAGR